MFRSSRRSFLAGLLASATGCARSTRPAEMDQPYDEMIGPFLVSWKNIDETSWEGNDACRERIRLSVEAYYRDHQWMIPTYHLWVYSSHRYVPCGGQVNGGGCASAVRIAVSVEIDALYHEINHIRLLLKGDPLWTSHSGSEWANVNSYVPPWN